jgi:glycolate oxidase iron-sulfur subunit
MHLVDHARGYIEETYRRPLPDRLIRAVLARVLPYPGRFRAALALAVIGKPLRPLLAGLGFDRLAAMLALAPAGGPASPAAPLSAPAESGARRVRVAILQGCAQPVLAPEINAAAARLLGRFGVEVVDVPGEGCCGALVHHMGREADGLAFARRNVDAWTRVIEAGGLDAIAITTSGCGTTIKDYGHMLREDPAYAARAARVSALAKDISEVLAGLRLPPPEKPPGAAVTYHSACSMQHGQQIKEEPKQLLRAAGFAVREPAEAHICCGSAGTYNILQPELAGRLRERKAGNIRRTAPEIVATGNIGCITQLKGTVGVPVLHTVELLDWAYGGPRPAALERAG